VYCPLYRRFPDQGPNLLGKTPEQQALVDNWTEVRGQLGGWRLDDGRGGAKSWS
jgi:hypothetical protein